MELVATYTTNELGSDPTVLRDFAQAAEGAGYARLTMGEHVLGADPDRPSGWTGPYTHETAWSEPFPTFGYLAAVTERIEFMTGVLILPQRQTALVAKQAAQLDVLCGGRLVLGVGTGWNAVEYDALGQDFHTRGQRMEEQIQLLRMLWREPVVIFLGRWDHVTRAGLNPLPPRRDIPIWMGGGDPRAIARAGRLGDGWYPLAQDLNLIREGVELMRESAAVADRDPDALGLQCAVRGADLESRIAAASSFADLGATHLAFSTGGLGLSSPQQHIDALNDFAEACSSLA